MAKFTVNSTRFDPYMGFKFKLKWDGQYVAGLSKCSALKRTTEVTPWYEGGDPSGPHQIPGKTKYDAITLEAGVTHDTAFETWANKVNNFQGDAARDLFSRQRIDGYMFDVEVLHLAERSNYHIKEVGVRWHDDGDSRLDLVAGNWRNMLDILRIRFGKSAQPLTAVALTDPSPRDS